MLGEQHLPFVLCAIFTAVLLSEGSQGILKLFLFTVSCHVLRLVEVVGNFHRYNNAEVSFRCRWGKGVGHARKEEGPNTNFFIKLKAFTSYVRVTFHKLTKFNNPEVTGSYFSLKIHNFFYRYHLESWENQCNYQKPRALRL